MSNLDTRYKKYFKDNITVFNAVREDKVSNFHITGESNNYNQSGTYITNMIDTPILGEYLLSNDIARHLLIIENNITKCYEYFDGGDGTLSYNKLNLKNGDVLTDAIIVHIEKGICDVADEIDEVKTSLTDMGEVKQSLVNALKTKGFVSANTDMSFDELIALVEQI